LAIGQSITQIGGLAERRGLGAAGFRTSAAEEPPENGERQPTLMVFDSREINRKLIKAMLREEGYRILEAARPAEAFELLEREKVDLIIVEFAMPQMSGVEACRRIKANPATKLVPVLVLTTAQGMENEVASIASGADEFLVMPLHPAVMRIRIQALLRHKAAIDSLEDVESILFALAQAIEQRDKVTGGHCERLATLSMTLGIGLGLSQPQILALHRGGYLHDIGKVSIPDAILFKPGRLTDEEWEVMRMHTVKGEEICRRTKTLEPVLPIIRSHHERWDGSGYPDGLRGEQIPLLARILQVADIFDALTSERPYKTALSGPEALEVLEKEARRGWRDPQVVSLLKRLTDMPFERSVQRSLENMREAIAADATLPLPLRL
jgi:putative two-component system response regulator